MADIMNRLQRWYCPNCRELICVPVEADGICKARCGLCGAKIQLIPEGRRAYKLDVFLSDRYSIDTRNGAAPRSV